MNTLTDLPTKDDNFLDLNAICRKMLEGLLNVVMDEQAAEVCAMTGTSRNGYRERSLITCVGEIVLRIPKLREGTYFPDNIVEKWSRTDTALASSFCEMWVNGVSNRDVEAIALQMGIEKMDKSRVSRLCKSLDEEINTLRQRDLSAKTWPYLWLDATYVKCREAGAARSSAVVIAVATDENANRQIIGISCVDTESYIAWRDFLLSLRKRGLNGVKIVTSDDHLGLVRAIKETMIGATWQRCIVHLERNVIDRVRKKGVGSAAVKALKTAFAETDPALVEAGYDRACELLRVHDAAGADLLEKAKPDALAYLAFPQEHKRWIRTNNICERLNGEIKRRTKSIQVFPSNESLIRLIGALCCEQNDEWAAKGNFMDAKKMKELTIQDKNEAPATDEIARVTRLVEEAFERTLKAA